MIVLKDNAGQQEQLGGNDEVEQDNEEDFLAGADNAGSNDFQYIVTIPGSKKTLMTRVLRYISCGVTFRMAHNTLQHTAEVFVLQSMACSRGDISMMTRVACASNLQQYQSSSC